MFDDPRESVRTAEMTLAKMLGERPQHSYPGKAEGDRAFKFSRDRVVYVGADVLKSSDASIRSLFARYPLMLKFLSMTATDEMFIGTDGVVVRKRQ